MSDTHLTRHHTNPALAGSRDIYADGVEIIGPARVLHASGQVGVRADGSTSPDFAEQCDQAVRNLLALLAAARMGPEHIAKLTCYVVGSQKLDALYDARRRLLPGVAPASTTVIIQGLASPEWLVEIEAIASVSR